MIKNFPNLIAPEQFDTMSQRVLQMNTNIEVFVRNEMDNHRKSYDPITGERFTNFQSTSDNSYKRVLLTSNDDVLVNCEYLEPPCGSDKAILYVHGAAFFRRSNDINLKTADRLCEMSGQTVVVPDYRIGADYTYDQMVSDVAVSYQYMIRHMGFDPSNITVIADSSGCVTALQTIREMEDMELPSPGKIVLWSPVAQPRSNDEDRIALGKHADIAFRTNDLFNQGSYLYHKQMGVGKDASDIFPVFGQYRSLSKTKVLIQVGGSELLIDDSYALHNIFSKVCSCTLEVYENLFHNFQTYYSMCDTARFCWQRVIDFITDEENTMEESA